MITRILLADHLALVRLGLRVILQSLPDVVVSAEAVDGRDAIERAHESKANIIIMDPWMPRANGVTATQRILEHNPRQKVLIFGVVESELAIRSLLRAGVQGLVYKTDPASDVVSAVKALQQNRMYFTARVEELILAANSHSQAHTAVHEPRKTPLSLRELEVVQILAEGGATKDVAATLNIRCKTAATHRSNLMRKLGVHNVAELTLYAVSQHIVKVPTFDALPIMDGLGNVNNFPARVTKPSATRAAA